MNMTGNFAYYHPGYVSETVIAVLTYLLVATVMELTLSLRMKEFSIKTRMLIGWAVSRDIAHPMSKWVLFGYSKTYYNAYVGRYISHLLVFTTYCEDS